MYCGPPSSLSFGFSFTFYCELSVMSFLLLSVFPFVILFETPSNSHLVFLTLEAFSVLRAKLLFSCVFWILSSCVRNVFLLRTISVMYCDDSLILWYLVPSDAFYLLCYPFLHEGHPCQIIVIWTFFLWHVFFCIHSLLYCDVFFLSLWNCFLCFILSWYSFFDLMSMMCLLSWLWLCSCYPENLFSHMVVFLIFFWLFFLLYYEGFQTCSMKSLNGERKRWENINNRWFVFANKSKKWSHILYLQELVLINDFLEIFSWR